MEIAIEVVYGTPEEQIVVALTCGTPVTIAQAIELSGIQQRFPEIVPEDDMVGVYGFREPLSRLLEDGDRVEIYRPLHLSPTEARKIRAASRKRRQKGG